MQICQLRAMRVAERVLATVFYSSRSVEGDFDTALDRAQLM